MNENKVNNKNKDEVKNEARIRRIYNISKYNSPLGFNLATD